MLLQIPEMRMMELKILLGINLIFISVMFTNNTELNELNYQFKTIKPIAYNVTLVIFRNENDYKNEYMFETVFYSSNFYKFFEKIIYKQLKKGNSIFYGESTILFEDIYKKRILRLHAKNMAINTSATKIRYFANDTYHEIVPIMHKIHKKSQTIEIIFDYPFLRDINTYRVTMKFLGSITNKGEIIKRSYINDKNKKS